MSKEKLIDLDQDQLDLLHTILQRHMPGKTVWAYGSRATWKATETSDLDLAVFDCDPMQIYDLKEALEESDLLISVDVMDWKSIPDDFKENIRGKYVVLQDKPRHPVGWRDVKLGELVKFNYGKSLPEQKRILGEIPVYSSAGLIDWHNEALVHSKGLIIGRKGTIGSVHKSEIPFFPIDTTFYIENSENDTDCNLDYLFYRLSSLGLKNLNSDSAVPGLNRNTAYAQRILLPPLPEQKAIAEVLSSLDDKIDLLHRQNKALEYMAQTLFRKWFVNEKDDSWKRGKLEDVFTVKGGTTPSTKEKSYWNGEINWTTPRDLSNHNSIFLLDTEKRITQQGLAKISSGLLPAGTVLLSSRAPVGYLAITDINLAVNQGYIAIVCDKILSNFFVYLWCKQNIEIIKNASGGTVFQEIPKAVFRQIDIAIPPEKTLLSFDQLIKPIFQKSKYNQYQIRKLENLRNTLLPKLMKGSVSLKAG